MAAKFFDADQLLFGEVDCRWRVTFSDRRQVIARAVAAPVTIRGSDMYVVSLSGSGALNWFETIGGGNLLPTYIDVAADGTIYISGRFNGFSDLDLGTNEYNLSTNGTLNKGFVTRWRRS